MMPVRATIICHCLLLMVPLVYPMYRMMLLCSCYTVFEQSTLPIDMGSETHRLQLIKVLICDQVGSIHG